MIENEDVEKPQQIRTRRPRIKQQSGTPRSGLFGSSFTLATIAAAVVLVFY